MVHVIGWPAKIVVSGLQTFVTPRSAESVTNVGSLAVLLLESGSDSSPLLTVTELKRFVGPVETIASGLTATVIWNDSLVPFARSPIAQVTFWLATVHGIVLLR